MLYLRITNDKVYVFKLKGSIYSSLLYELNKSNKSFQMVQFSVTEKRRRHNSSDAPAHMLVKSSFPFHFVINTFYNISTPETRLHQCPPILTDHALK